MIHTNIAMAAEALSLFTVQCRAVFPSMSLTTMSAPYGETMIACLLLHVCNSEYIFLKHYTVCQYLQPLTRV